MAANQVNVSTLIQAAFALSFTRYPELHQKWVKLSHQFGCKLPGSLLHVSICRAGNLDILIRALEDDGDADNPGFSCEHKSFLSELWVGHIYEVFRILSQQKLDVILQEINGIHHDLKLLRISMEKYQIANDRMLEEPLILQKRSLKGNSEDFVIYDKKDKRRSHIMPCGESERGSCIWHVIDVKAHKSFWIERRSLSERILSLLN